MKLRSRSTHLMRATVLALALGAGLLVAGCAGSKTNSTADRAETTIAASAPRAGFSGMVDIGGGRKMYMTCRGKGSPTVVFVSGGRNAADPIIRLYAGSHPAEVGGLVLVDALSEDLWNGLTPKQEAVYDELNAPPPGTRAEYLDHPAIFRQLRESPPAPPVPTVVLTADQPPVPLTKEALAKGQYPAGVDQEFANDLWASQLAAQDKLAEKFPGAAHITDTNSAHYIQLYNPRLVSDSIRSVVEAERDGEKTVSDVKGAD